MFNFTSYISNPLNKVQLSFNGNNIQYFGANFIIFGRVRCSNGFYYDDNTNQCNNAYCPINYYITDN